MNFSHFRHSSSRFGSVVTEPVECAQRNALGTLYKMNFLAHLHLSYPDAPEMVGNFIGDYVKGRKYQDYPTDISRGIQLHRRIDTFTDTHPLQRQCKRLFVQDYGLYAGIITDMLFDHYLAQQWDTYCSIDLSAFSALSYQTLEDYHDVLPARVQLFLPKLKAVDRLASYATLDGFEEATTLMSHYTSLPNHTSKALRVIQENNSFLVGKFEVFYQELIEHVSAIRPTL